MFSTINPTIKLKLGIFTIIYLRKYKIMLIFKTSAEILRISEHCEIRVNNVP